MKSLYFIRHAESEFNRANKWAGSTDTPLTETGHAQAKAAAAGIRKQGLSFDIIISSPLERALETAKYVADALSYPHDKIVVDERLIERNFGSLEGKKSLVAATKYLVNESAIDSHEGVEALLELQTRADEFLKYLYNLPHDSVLVAGHGAFGRALRRAAKQHPLTLRGRSFANAEMERLI